jgi:hypothetical protein
MTREEIASARQLLQQIKSETPWVFKEHKTLLDAQAAVDRANSELLLAQAAWEALGTAVNTGSPLIGPEIRERTDKHLLLAELELDKQEAVIEEVRE